MIRYHKTQAYFASDSIIMSNSCLEDEGTHGQLYLHVHYKDMTIT